jgi:hypothetical protein
MKYLISLMALLFSCATFGGVVIPNQDSESAQIVRIKTAPLGWSFEAHGIEFETCVLNSIHSKNADGTDHIGIILKLFKQDGTEITTQAEADTSCVETRIDWEPAYDYELIGGLIALEDRPTEDFRIWAVGVPDIPAASGGSIEMISTINMRFIVEGMLQFDGRSSTYNATLHTNKMRLVIKTAAGFKDKGVIVFEHFKQ